MNKNGYSQDLTNAKNSTEIAQDKIIAHNCCWQVRPENLVLVGEGEGRGRGGRGENRTVFSFIYLVCAVSAKLSLQLNCVSVFIRVFVTLSVCACAYLFLSIRMSVRMSVRMRTELDICTQPCRMHMDLAELHSFRLVYFKHKEIFLVVCIVSDEGSVLSMPAY